jgi:hypothetical protein
MACTPGLLSPALALWLGAIAVSVGVLLFAYTRAFSIEKLGAFGFEFKLQEPIQHLGAPRAMPFAVIAFVVGVVLALFGGFRSSAPVVFPTSFSDVCAAQLQLSKVDDEMEVRMNDVLVAKAVYGEAPGWVNVLSYLKPGANKIEVLVSNGPYGGCGGMLVGRLNNIESPSFRWEKQKTENQAPLSACFYETFTLNLSQ